MRTLKIGAPNGAVAVRESEGRGPAAVLIHGNSSSSRVYSRQLEGALGERFRLVAVDLPGHGASDDANEPSAYSLPGHARAVRTVVDALQLHGAVFAGWSLGGHVALEMAPDLPSARGFVIFGAPPLAFPPAMATAFLPHPAMGFTFMEKANRDQAAAYVASWFKPGFADVPAFFLDDALRTDGRARRGLATSMVPGGYRDEIAVARDLRAPLAVLHGAEDQLVNGGYFASASHADALARRGADDPRRRAHAAVGDACGVRRAGCGVHRGDGVRRLTAPAGGPRLLRGNARPNKGLRGMRTGNLLTRTGAFLCANREFFVQEQGINMRLLAAGAEFPCRPLCAKIGAACRPAGGPQDRLRSPSLFASCSDLTLICA